MKQSAWAVFVRDSSVYEWEFQSAHWDKDTVKMTLNDVDAKFKKIQKIYFDPPKGYISRARLTKENKK